MSNFDGDARIEACAKRGFLTLIEALSLNPKHTWEAQFDDIKEAWREKQRNL